MSEQPVYEPPLRRDIVDILLEDLRAHLNAGTLPGGYVISKTQHDRLMAYGMGQPEGGWLDPDALFRGWINVPRVRLAVIPDEGWKDLR